MTTIPELHRSPSVEFEGVPIPEAWQKTFEACPSELKREFLPIITAGRISPEVYAHLNITLESSDESKKMGPGYHDPNKERIAEADYNSRRVRFLAGAKDRDLDFRSHVLRHEVGHFARYYIDHEEYATMIATRPAWANGRYIQALSQKESPQLVHEMLADDLGDFLASSDAEDMLLRRLTRMGPKEELENLSQADRDELLAEADRVFAFFTAMLDPKRIFDPHQFSQDFQNDWFDDDMLYDSGFVQSLPEDAGLSYFKAPKKPAQRPQNFDFFAWLFSPGS